MSFPNTAARFARTVRTRSPRNGSTGQVAARGLRAADVMATKLITLHPDTPVQEAIGTLLKHRISGAPVVGPGRAFFGVFSEKICMRVLLDAAAEQVPCCGTVGQYADANARTVAEDTDLLTMVHLFNEGRFRRLPVLREAADGTAEVVGQVSRRDVLRAAYELGTFKPQRETPRPLYLSGVRAADDAVPV